MKPDPATLVLIRSLIPYVRPLRDNNWNFPKGFCGLTTAQITSYMKPVIMGVRHRCGEVDIGELNFYHMWVAVGDINIDFTAHQFESLKPYVTVVDGFDVLVGSDDYLQSLGFHMQASERCAQQVIEDGNLIAAGVYGNCTVKE